MDGVNGSTCPDCGGDLKRYDKVRRKLHTKGGASRYIELQRFRCIQCGKIHREASEDIFPHKWYEAEIITGVVEGIITCETLGYEDYPCEQTMKRWIEQKDNLIAQRPRLRNP